MKKRFMTAAALTLLVAAFTTLGGCKLFFGQGGGDDEGSAEPWTYSVSGAQVVSWVGGPGGGYQNVTTLSGTLRFITADGMGELSALEVGTVTNGLIEFSLPEEMPSGDLDAIFALYADLDEAIVDPLSHQAFWAWGLDVYDGAVHKGSLYYRPQPSGQVLTFLYSEQPLTVTVEDFDFQAAPGWNCLLHNESLSTVNSNLLENAKWVFSPLAD